MGHYDDLREEEDKQYYIKKREILKKEFDELEPLLSKIRKFANKSDAMESAYVTLEAHIYNFLRKEKIDVT